MSHEPALRVPVLPGVAPEPCSTSLLAELERRCLDLRTRPGAARIDPVFARLDDFAIGAAALIDGLSDPAGPQAAIRRAFRRAHADLGKAFDEIERLLALPARLGIPAARFSNDMLAATALIATLAPIRADADRLHTALSREVRAELHPGIGDPLAAQLADCGCADPVDAARRVRGWRADRVDRDALDALQPRLIAALGQYPDPDGALAAFDAIVAGQPADSAFFASLRQRPASFGSLLDLLGHAPSLTQQLLDQPTLIGRLIEGSASTPLPSSTDLDAEFGRLTGPGGREAAPARIARAVDAHRFNLGLRLIERTADPLDIVAAHARLAEAALRAIADHVLARLREEHGVVPGSNLVILALGRLGGGALTNSSPLDLSYLFTGDHGARSDGRSPLHANAYYDRAAERITAAMRPLYAMAASPPPWRCGSVESFDARMSDPVALAGARPVYGSDAARRVAMATVRDALREPRPVPRRVPAGDTYDVERARGGLSDLDLTVRLNQLGGRADVVSELHTAIGAQVRSRLLDPATAGAYETLSRLAVALDLLAPGGGEPAPERRPIIAHLCGYDHWDGLETDYGAARVIVQESWRATLARTMATNA